MLKSIHLSVYSSVSDKPNLIPSDVSEIFKKKGACGEIEGLF